MLHSINIFLIMLTAGSQVIFDFNSSTDPRAWQVVDDVVMGGRSAGNFLISEEGNGVFYGTVSLENNGGFSSVRSLSNINEVSADQRVRIRLKGDGKSYQFRIKHSSRAYYSYVHTFDTSGKWEQIIIPLKDMYPSFRGRKLDIPNYSHQGIREITFLIANKKPQEFKLEIDKIEIID